MDWESAEDEIGRYGSSPLGQLLTASEAAGLVGLYDDAEHFRSTVEMARHRFGEGQYRYFRAPLPGLVEGPKQALYPRLLPIARDWHHKLGRPTPWPETLDEWLTMCHAAG